ncbi:unnamed protein product [Darwinula stevensoni]|uniref:BZIP domain-containing protein n=1 Tax=Darwinula stevensoni TaxID=69355 RepID=A0A7R9A4D3_9CRUS|nr:unnamed protein product [Darwinula stevensoni]CAG0889765.1 unnamed protein product [Darwinula stevensoni]
MLKTELSSKNKISALNNLATSVLNYSFGVFDWSPTELQAIDRATRKLLTMHHTHHPKAAVERLYLLRCKGGRGLIEFESLYKCACLPGYDFDPSKVSFPPEELKPTPMLKKSRKKTVPDTQKDDKYWSRREKNNLAAKRSRDARRLKENQVTLRALYLEEENSKLKSELEVLRAENDSLKSRLQELSACNVKI